MLTKISRYVLQHPELLLHLSSLENLYCRKALTHLTIDSPTYITGLARSGTTLVLEFLSQGQLFATHRYGDFPFIYIPYLWNKVRRHTFRSHEHLTERAHKDGMLVNSNSPESMEEIIWAHFHKNTPHDYYCLDADHSNPEFERFYIEHIKKLLHTRQKKRYASKANYNLARILYLRKLFPNLRCIVMYRNPVAFVASSIKQDDLFTKEQRKTPEKLVHTDITQHFEFGLHKRQIPFGQTSLMENIEHGINHSQLDERIKGWALYWQVAYTYIKQQFHEHNNLENNVMLVSYDRLCSKPNALLSDINRFCSAGFASEQLSSFSQTIQKPDYYQVNFSNQQQDSIMQITHDTLAWLDEHSTDGEG